MELKSLIVSAAQGYALAPEVQENYFKNRQELLSKYRTEIEQMMAEPLFLDDNMRGSVDAFMNFIVRRCETLICREGKEVVGIAIINVTKVNRSAELIGWVAPKYRRGYANQKKVRLFMQEDILPYAFTRMRLVRIEFRCDSRNRAALKFATNSGFEMMGIARLDLLIFGLLSDSFLLERINPAFIIQPAEEITHGSEPLSPPRQPEYSSDGDNRQYESGDDAPVESAA